MMLKGRIFRFSLFLCFVFLAGYTSQVNAQDAEGGDLMDMSLDDLLNMEVSTASKKSEKATDAPGVMSVISQDDIRRFGVTTLFELLERLPGTMLMFDNQFPRGNVSMRGDATPEVNNHVLLLLNGRPMRQSTHGAQYTPIYNCFPLSIVDKIEVIRGPGSVLYGTNAYSGVINIITKGKETKEVHATGRLGSYSTQNPELSGSYGEKDYYVSGAARYSRSENLQDFELKKDSIWEAKAPYNQESRETGANFNAFYKGLKITNFYSEYYAQKDNTPGVLATGSPIKSKYYIGDIGYEYAILPQWTAAINFGYNYYKVVMGAQVGSMVESSKDYVYEFTNYITPMDNINVVVGGSIYQLSGVGDMGVIKHIPDYEESRYSAYAQVDYRPIEILKLIAGGQINQVENVDLDFVPRLGVIYNITPELGTKLLFGQAFRSPFSVERNINLPMMFGIVGNKDLTPEKVTTYDVQLFYAIKQLQASITYFNSKQKDLIGTVLTPQMWLQFMNLSKFTAQGVELEGKYTFLNKLYLNGSFVYTYRENSDGTQDRALVPEAMAKLGVSYDALPGLNISIQNNGFSKPHSFKPASLTPHPQADVMSYLTANIGVDVVKVAKLNIKQQIKLNLYGTNLLGQAIYMQNSRKWDNTYPRQIGQAFYFDITVGL